MIKNSTASIEFQRVEAPEFLPFKVPSPVLPRALGRLECPSCEPRPRQTGTGVDILGSQSRNRKTRWSSGCESYTAAFSIWARALELRTRAAHSVAAMAFFFAMRNHCSSLQRCPFSWGFFAWTEWPLGAQGLSGLGDWRIFGPIMFSHFVWHAEMPVLVSCVVFGVILGYHRLQMTWPGSCHMLAPGLSLFPCNILQTRLNRYHGNAWQDFNKSTFNFTHLKSC